MAAVTNTKSNRAKRAVKFILLIAISAGCIAAIWWFRPANAERRYSRMSLVDLRHLLDRDSNNAKAWRQFAIRLARDGDSALAEPALLRALELNPNDPILATGLGEMYMAADRYPEAFQIIKASAETHPADTVTHRALGDLYLRKHSFPHAYETYEAVVRVNNGADDAWYQMAVCSEKMQQLAKAQDAITHALALKPTRPEYIVEKGAVDVALGNVADGISETERAAQLAPNDLRIQATLVILLLKHHRDAADLSNVEAAIGRLEQLSPNLSAIPYMRGRLEMLRQNWPAAVRYLELAWRSNPLRDEVCLALSQAYRRVNRATEADALLKVYRKRQGIRFQLDEQQGKLASEPRNTEIYKRLADLEMQLGDRESALETLKSGLQINPNDAVMQKWMNTLQPTPPAKP